MTDRMFCKKFIVGYVGKISNEETIDFARRKNATTNKKQEE